MISSVAAHIRSVIGFACFGTIVLCGIWSAGIHSKIMEKVNARLPEADRFKPLWWGPLKKDRLYQEYHRLFPGGNDLNRLHRLTIIMFAALALLLILSMTMLIL
jgi:hypothetical protein